MAKTLTCPSCQNMLRVGEEFEGQQMRCPVCHVIFRVPGDPVWRSNPGPAVNEFGEIVRGSTARPADPPQPQQPAPPPHDPQPHQRPPQPEPGHTNVEPHRATAVLLLGILSLGCLMGFLCYAIPCFVGAVLGLIGWFMGQTDLAKMQAGQMDRSGHGQTQAGWICSIIGTLLNAMMVLLCGGMILLVMIMELGR